MPSPGPRYDVLDLRYADGKPAVLRHTDGSGFAYYPSGRKAVCVSACGLDGQGRARRFSAVVHDDGPRNPIVGVFDDWGLGYADGMPSQGDAQPPKIMIADKVITVIDGGGKATEVPRSAKTTDLALRINPSLTLRLSKGRIVLDFQCDGRSHTFAIGEMHGEEVQGMVLASGQKPLGEESTRQLSEATQKLEGVRDKVSALKVDPSQRDTKPTFSVDTTSLKDVLENLTTLKNSLAHPNLASPDLKWGSETKLKKLLAEAHPQCPGQVASDRGKWSIARVSGKCTEERLANAKPTVNAPKSISQVSQLKLPDLITENASSNTLLVVICLAAFAKEQSNYARLLAEKAHAELWHRFCPKGDSGPLPVKLVAVELTEGEKFAEQYGIKEVPYCLMFLGGQQVYSKRLRGIRMAPRDAASAKPKVLLVEPNPAQQLKLERNLRRNGYCSDLAMDGAQAVRMASRTEGYGVLLCSSLVRSEQLRAAVAAAKRGQPGAVVLAFDATVLGAEEDLEQKKRFLDECSYVFPFAPSYTGLAAVLARFDVTAVEKGLASVPCTSHKQDFLGDVLGMLEKGGRSTAPVAGGS
eukprot:TRINITY_DN109116_c0_g1_i1.p1 TRINITY_DN109116_c0_g1~~TRINITY_DN109116_c0_g1_i1.p1  ORF type:complete len:598 (-),score=143.58 TRINITY_DN109116_c0_g1_i1:60-1808(-)